MVEGSMTIIKYLMFVFNFLLVICGVILIVVGSVFTQKDYTSFMGHKYLSIPVLLIVVGVLVFFIAFFGCCGAVRENYCMVITFAALVFIVFIVELAGGIYAYMYRSEVSYGLKENLNSSLAQNKSDANLMWEQWQINFECCGVEGSADYKANNREVPPSCCGKSVGETCSEEEIYKPGCYSKLLEQIKGSIGVVGGVAIGIGVFELIGCVCAWILAFAIKRDYGGV